MVFHISLVDQQNPADDNDKEAHIEPMVAPFVVHHQQDRLWAPRKTQIAY